MLSFVYIKSKIKGRKFKNTSVCICTLGKEENRYIREYIQHYKNYGVDKIFLYDNNDINGEHFESIINDYILDGFVEIFNWRGKTSVIYNIMNECYNKNKNNYSWIIFYELDEFIHLSNYTNIKTFLHSYKFDQCQVIYLNLLIHTDNNQLYYRNNSLFQRFPEIVPKSKNNRLQVKMIIKGNINDLHILSTAKCTKKNKNTSLITCNGFGQKIEQIGFNTNKTDFDYNYVDHFFCKSTEEFVNKLAKGDALLVEKNALYNYKIIRIKRYFFYNDFTMKKLQILEKGLKINLEEFKNMKQSK